MDPSTARTVVEFVIRPLSVVLVVLVAVLVAHLGAKAIRRTLERIARQAAERSGSTRAGGRVHTMAALVANLWRFFVALVTIAIVLGMLGVDLTPLLASATVIGATIGFGAQALVRDYLSGFLLAVEDQFGIGDAITVNDTTGVVEDLTLRVTRVRGADGTVWYLPNGDIRSWPTARGAGPRPASTSPWRRPRSGGSTRPPRWSAGPPPGSPTETPFAATCTEPPEVLGMVAADADGCTLRVTLRTVPAQRDALERALRAALVRALADEGLWPEPAAGGPA